LLEAGKAWAQIKIGIMSLEIPEIATEIACPKIVPGNCWLIVRRVDAVAGASMVMCAQETFAEK